MIRTDVANYFCLWLSAAKDTAKTLNIWLRPALLPPSSRWWCCPVCLFVLAVITLEWWEADNWQCPAICPRCKYTKSGLHKDWCQHRRSRMTKRIIIRLSRDADFFRCNGQPWQLAMAITREVNQLELFLIFGQTCKKILFVVTPPPRAVRIYPLSTSISVLKIVDCSPGSWTFLFEFGLWS